MHVCTTTAVNLMDSQYNYISLIVIIVNLSDFLTQEFIFTTNLLPTPPTKSILLGINLCTAFHKLHI